MYSSLCDKVFAFGGKNSDVRLKPITKITPHHMAGVMDAYSCAKMHYNSEGSSANYYIGSDGIICGGVDENRRAWTSGSRDNDTTAVTIEVSNCMNGAPWKITDDAYKSLVRLCADICKRYGINPHYNGRTDGTITIHKMFQNTECCGKYLEDIIKSGKFEKDIINAMDSKPVPEPEPEPKPSIHLEPTYYIVKRGDTLTKIANMFNSSIGCLKTINNLENANLIKVNQKLIVTDVYIVKSGDTLTSIAKSYSTTVKKLSQINHIKDVNKIYVNQELYIK